MYESKPELPEEGVEVPVDQLDPETLNQMIESFILREGTDYGEREALLKTKIEQIKNRLRRRESRIVLTLRPKVFRLLNRDDDGCGVGRGARRIDGL